MEFFWNSALRSGCYYGFGGKKKKNCFKHDLSNLETKTGRYKKPNIIAKKIIKNLKLRGRRGGVVDVTPLPVKSQVFRTDFVHSHLFRRTNIFPTDGI